MAEITASSFIDSLVVDGKLYEYYSLKKAEKLFGNFDYLPYSIKVILENLLRNLDDKVVDKDQIFALADSIKKDHRKVDIFYKPVRVLMQDFTGVPALVDLAAMRQAVSNFGIVNNIFIVSEFRTISIVNKI